jgi:hypothetical protein
VTPDEVVLQSTGAGAGVRVNGGARVSEVLRHYAHIDTRSFTFRFYEAKDDLEALPPTAPDGTAALRRAVEAPADRSATWARGLVSLPMALSRLIFPLASEPNHLRLAVPRLVPKGSTDDLTFLTGCTVELFVCEIPDILSAIDRCRADLPLEEMLFG